MNKAQRLNLFFSRLEQASPASDFNSALALIACTLNEIEDEFSGVAHNPTQWLSDGRMYPPQIDNARKERGFPSVTRLRSRGHNTYISTNGAFEIRSVHNLPESDLFFSKLGSEGKGVWESD